MPIIHEIATMTAKGQITVPKPIRQALRAYAGTKVTFELHENGQVVVSRVDAEHEDPAIRAFLGLIEKEIEAGRGVEEILDNVAQRMWEHAKLDIDFDEPIEGDVELYRRTSVGCDGARPLRSRHASRRLVRQWTG